MLRQICLSPIQGTARTAFRFPRILPSAIVYRHPEISEGNIQLWRVPLRILSK